MTENVRAVLSRLKDDVLGVTEQFVQVQFSEMGPMARSRSRKSRKSEARACDPEALLVFGLDLAKDLPPLSEAIDDWVLRCAHLMNPARLAYLGVQDFEPPGRRKQPDRNNSGLDHFPIVNLAFRLRCVLGFSCRAEVVRVLLAANDRPMAIGRITEGAALSERQVRRVLWDMQEGGLVHAHREPPLFRFSLNAEMWSGFMGIHKEMLPEYVHWPEYFAACSEVLRWLRFAEVTGTHDPNPLLLSTEPLLDSLRRPFSAVIGAGPGRTMTDDQFWPEFADYIQSGLSLLED